MKYEFDIFSPEEMGKYIRDFRSLEDAATRSKRASGVNFDRFWSNFRVPRLRKQHQQEVLPQTERKQHHKPKQKHMIIKTMARA